MRSNASDYVNWDKYIKEIAQKIQAIKEIKNENGKPALSERTQEIIDDISKIWSALSKERKMDKHNQKGQNLMSSGPEFTPEDMAKQSNLSDAMGIMPSLLGDVDVINLGILGPGEIRPLNLDNKEDAQLLMQQSINNDAPADHGFLKAAFSGFEYQKNLEKSRKRYQEIKQQLLKFKEIIETTTQKPFTINHNFKNTTSYHLILAEIDEIYQNLKNDASKSLVGKTSISVQQLINRIKQLQNQILILRQLFDYEKNDLTFIKILTKQNAKFQKDASTYAKDLRKEVAEHKDDVMEAIDSIDELSDKEEENEEPSQAVKAFQDFDASEKEIATGMLKTMDKLNNKLAAHSRQTIMLIQSRLNMLEEVSVKILKIENELQRMQKLLLLPSVKHNNRHRLHHQKNEGKKDILNKEQTVKATPTKM